MKHLATLLIMSTLAMHGINNRIGFRSGNTAHYVLINSYLVDGPDPVVVVMFQNTNTNADMVCIIRESNNDGTCYEETEASFQ